MNKVQDSLLAECIAALYREELFPALLAEPEELRSKRRSLELKLSELHKALELLVQICDAAACA